MYHLFWTHFLGTNWCVLLVCHIKQYPCQCQLIAINQPLSMKGWSERLLKHVKKHRTHDSSSDGRLAGWFCRKQADTSPCCGWVDGEGVSDLCQDLVPVTWERVWKWSGGKDSSLIAAGDHQGPSACSHAAGRAARSAGDAAGTGWNTPAASTGLIEGSIDSTLNFSILLIHLFTPVCAASWIVLASNLMFKLCIIY